MPFSMTRYFQKAAGDALWQKTPFPVPAQMYLSLHTADPTEAGLFTAELSTVGTNYARIPLLSAMGATNLATGVSQNTSVITSLPSLIDQGYVTNIGICDALTGGNMWLYGALSTAFLMDVGRAFQLVPGAMQIAFD